jgi:hypothetical protein
MDNSAFPSAGWYEERQGRVKQSDLRTQNSIIVALEIADCPDQRIRIDEQKAAR